MRRIVIQFGVIAGMVAFGLTFWLALSYHHSDIFHASMRAVGAGAAMLVFSLVISALIEKLGGPSES